MTNVSDLFFKRKAFLIPLLLLSLVIIFNVGVNDVSATPANIIYVNGSSGNNDWNGLTSTHTSGINGPKATIANATGTVKSNGRVHISSGIYNENNIQINTNMTIMGENQKNTVIDGQQSGNAIFTIISGVNITIINLTLTNGSSQQGGAIHIENSGTLTVNNSTFTNNSATNGGGGAIKNAGTLIVNSATFTNNTASNDGGGAIFNNPSGIITVMNCTFTNNTAYTGYGGSNEGGAIFNYGTLTVTDCTFTNNSATSDFGGANYGGAIFNTGTSTVNNSTFTNNRATNSGGAILNNYSGTLTVDNCTFTNNTSNNGGAIANFGGALTVTNCTFTNNYAEGGGGAILNNPSSTLNINNSNFTDNNVNGTAGGGAINNNGGTLTVTNCTFNSNRAPGYLAGGGAIYTKDGTLTVNRCSFTYNYSSFWGGAINNAGTLNVNNSTFIGNSVVTSGGAIYNTGTATVNFNRFIRNSRGSGVNTISNSGGTFDAKYNWWGTNTSPAAEIIGDVSYDPWIVLTVTANPKTIKVGGKSNITADLLHDSNGTYHDPINGHVPDGLTVTFSSDSNGTVTPISSITTNNKANTTFKGIKLGTSAISTTIDNQTVITNITISKTATATSIHVDPVSGIKGGNVNLTAKLTDKTGNVPVKGVQILFSINGAVVGTAKTNNVGIATLKYTLSQNNGTYPIFVEYLGNSIYSGSNDTRQLTVNSTPVNPVYELYLQISSSNGHPKIGETFKLTYKLGNNGPDNATNVTVTIPIPAGFSVVNITGDGNWIYNTETGTIIWTLTNVAVGDPYLHIMGETTKAGIYVFGSSLSTETLQLNSADIAPTNTTVKTAEKTTTNSLPMQHTGVPIIGLILAILMVFGGFIPRLKK